MKVTIQKQVDVRDLSDAELLSMDKKELVEIIHGLLREKVVYNPFGIKRPHASSKYYYVCKNGKWWTAHIVEKSKSIFSDKFNTEIEAAIAVDIFLDGIKDTKRPRNRDEFEEVMDAYTAKRGAP